MIKILNPEFFRVETETVLKDEVYYTLISLFTDPKDFELAQYRRIPFISMVIHSDYNISESNISEEELIEMISTLNFNQYSMYGDERYDELTKLFSNDNKYHTIIFEQIEKHEVENKPEKILLVFSLPCNGIIRQIKKSEYYKLYNASLIVLKRPFKWFDLFYDKLIYGLVEIDAYFEFQEFVFTDSCNDIRRMNIHYFALNTVTTDELGETPPIYVKDLDITYNKISSAIQCKNSEERHDLFKYFGKGMFSLSDIPDNLMQRGNTISVKLK